MGRTQEQEVRSTEQEDQLFFHPGTVIYPYGNARGWTISTTAGVNLIAVETKEKVRGRKVYRALNRVTIYRDGRYLTLAEGKTFQAGTRSAKKRPIENALR